MSKPRYRRRKQDRPDEITVAAFDAFAEKGYAATRVEEVARRAGVSKGLLYLYFKTKEELFKAVVQRLLVPRIDKLEAAIDQTTLSVEAFMRGPMLELMQRLPGSRAGVVVRLMIAEGSRHPDVVSWYWDNVLSRILSLLNRLMQRGVQRGEFQRSAITQMPQLLLAPVLMSVLWKLVLTDHELDSDRLITMNLDIMLAQLKAPQ